MSKLWSELPAKAYSINIGGQQMGLGMREIWDQIPGAWNIFQLVWGPPCEELLAYSGQPESFPVDCGMLPHAVAMAIQLVDPTKTWGQLATEVSPAKFLQILKDHPDCHNFILPYVFKHVFWERAEAKAASYHEVAGNVIRGNFGAKVH